MANGFYDYARELAATTGLGWTSGTFHAYLLDAAAYTFSAAHQYLSSVAGASRIAGPLALASLTAAGGACDAADAVFVAVSGVSCEAVFIVKDTGVEATSPNVAYIDQGTGLPITPNGGDITVTWDSGVNKILRV